MELRVLKYFLAVARQENISRAAAELNLTQPTLSRQIADLEAELGTALLLRGKRRTLLTEAGLLLKARAAEILSLAEQTAEELSRDEELTEGDVFIGCGETEGMREIADVLAPLHASHPRIRIHLTSGNEELVTDGLRKGLLDFGLLCSAAAPVDYAYRRIAHQDLWGLYLDRANPLARKKGICAADMMGEPLIVSRQAMAAKEFDHWLGKSAEGLTVAATYNLVYNAAFLIEQGFGSVLSFAGLIPTKREGGKALVFRPLTPKLFSRNYLIWKKDRVFSRAGKLVLTRFEQAFSPLS